MFRCSCYEGSSEAQFLIPVDFRGILVVLNNAHGTNIFRNLPKSSWITCVSGIQQEQRQQGAQPSPARLAQRHPGIPRCEDLRGARRSTAATLLLAKRSLVRDYCMLIKLPADHGNPSLWQSLNLKEGLWILLKLSIKSYSNLETRRLL